MYRVLLFVVFTLLLFDRGYSAGTPGPSIFVHQLKSIAYSYNSSRDSLFISFHFDHPPLIRPSYSLKRESGIMIEFHNARLHPEIFTPDAPRPIIDIGIKEYSIGENIFITKASIMMEFSLEFNVTREGNLIILGMKLPGTFVSALAREKKIARLKPNKLLSYSIASTPTEMEFLLKFRRIPESRVTYRLKNPDRIIYDFYGTGTGSRTKRYRKINTSPVKNVRVQNFEIMDIDVTRFIIFSYDAPSLDESTVENILVLRLKSEGWKISKQEPLGTFQHKWVSIAMSTITISYGLFRIFLLGGN